jgi:glutamate-1-semialdehyde aminotransferase
MAMSMVALQAVRSTLPRALYLDMARLTARGLMRLGIVFIMDEVVTFPYGPAGIQGAFGIESDIPPSERPSAAGPRWAPSPGPN